MEKMQLRQFINFHIIREKPLAKLIGISEEELMKKLNLSDTYTPFTPAEVKKIEKAFRNVYGITYKDRKGEKFYTI